MNHISTYIDHVLSGKYKAGMLIRHAVERHVNELTKQNTEAFPYYFDYEQAERHIKFAQVCRHWKGEKGGERIQLEPHQLFEWAMIYGWRNASDNTYRFHRTMKLVARKNFKTTERAIMAIDHLLIDPPTGAQVYAGATKTEQAMIVVNDAGKIIQKTPELRDRFILFFYGDKVKRVVTSSKDSFFAPLAKENQNSTQDGLDPSYAVIDEYHAHLDDSILNIIESGMGNRIDYMVNIISTAGKNKQGPCYSSMRDLGIKVLQGIIEQNETLYLFHELDKDDDWNDQDVWIKANPRMGNDTNFIKYLTDRYQSAKLQQGEKEADFKTKNLNMWVDQYNTWIADELWVSCGIDNDESEFYGKEAFAGLDLASTRDMNSFVVNIPLNDNECLLIPYFWIPQAQYEKRTEKIDVDFYKWKQSGFIKVLPGNSISHELMARDILELSKKFNIKSVGIDPRMKDSILPHIDEKKGGFLKVTEFSQDIRTMSFPTKEFEKMILDNRIKHLNNPILRWQLSNVAVWTDANENIKLVKNKSTDKIDGVVASVMAIGEWLTYKMTKKPSVYLKRGVISI